MSTGVSSRARVRAWLVSLLAVSVVAMVVVSERSSAPARQPRPAPVAEAPDAATAMAAAWMQGSRVEIVDQRTPTRTVYANPDGTSTAELSVLPTRVKQRDGWVPVDTTVVVGPDGTVGPRAVVGGLTLSGGGSTAPLTRMVKDGRSFALYWPGSLPAPTVDGARVTYPEVLPGVDLVMYAEPNGYRQHLVVRTAEAAKNPALARIAFRTETEGLTLTVDESGALHAVDDANQPVFVAPPSLMWDSSGPVPDRSAPVRVIVQDGSLVLHPDPALLADPAVVFPVTIDPGVRTWDKSNWATVLSGNALWAGTPVRDVPFWWRSAAPGGGNIAQVGQCWNGEGECGNPSIGEAWGYFQFDTSFVAGKRIIGTEFKSVVVHSPNCDVKAHQLFVVPGGAQIWPQMTWNSKLNGGLLSEVGAPGVHRNCPGNRPIGFGMRPDGIGMVTSYFLKAANSGDPLAWRKYDPAQTKMFVHFNTRPNNPDQLSTDPPLPAPCRWCAGRRWIGDGSITLKARLSDPDGDQVRPKWRVSVDGREIASWDGPYQASGATHDAPISLNDKHNKLVGWWLHADDGWDITDPGVSGTPFMVDLIPPKRAPIVSSVLYREDNRWHGGVGVPGTFQFAADPETGELNDIDHYLYGWADPPTTKVDAAGALGGSASVSLAPPGDGPQTLFVQAVDRAGHKSPKRVYRIYVRAGNGPLAQWSYEGNANDTAFLGDRHGTLNGNASYGPGAVGNAVRLDGSLGTQVVAPNTVRTDTSFSVAAWLKLDRLPPEPHTFTAVSQDGTNVGGFFLGYRNEAGGAWELYTPGTDSQSPGGALVRAPAPPQLGTWTHVAGVYDAQDRKIRIYVNGVLGSTADFNGGFHASGSLVVGRGKWNGGPANHWPGAIDEVQVYDRVVSAAELRSAVGRANVQVADWRFDDGSGTTARNSVEGGAAAVLHNGASFRPEGAVKGSLALDGVDDHATTSGPVVRTDQSFSVAAWVKLDRVDTGWYTVLSQDGNRICGFCLQYEGSRNRWVFVMARSDEDSPTGFDFVTSTSPPVAGVWTHLAGVYDAATRKLRLYVDGDLAGETTRGADWTATGPFAIGRAKVLGSSGQFLAGGIDEVRVYSRAMSQEEVRGIVGADGVAAGEWKLDGNATDSSGRNLHGTLGGTPEWAAGQTSSPDPSDLAVKLDGTSAHMTAPHAIDTSGAFSVAAWVRLDRLSSTTATVVSQDGTHVGGFFLRALPDGRWSFALPRTDQLNPVGDGIDGSAAQIGVWTHLAGVYSRDRQRIELYVNGVLVGSAAHATGFNAAGSLQIGRAWWNDRYIDYFPGAIDDVSVYSRALFADEIRTMAGRDVSLVHNWQLDESSGSNAADAVGARGGTLRNGASFGPGRVGNSVRLDGADDLVSTSGVDLRTDQSFTVGAWVYLNSNECDLTAVSRCQSDAVTVDGARTSKFRLGHLVDSDQAPRGKWIFEMPESDTDDAPVTEAALSVEPGEVATWVHLVGVYDAPTRKIWLYVNGDRVDDGTLNTPWHASGGLQIGRGKAAGQPAQFWRGDVDDVRLYTGVHDKDRVSALYRSYPEPAAPPTLPTANAGYWKFNEGTGTTAEDSSGSGRHAALLGGATWNGARSGWGVLLDGTTGYAETAGPVVDTTQSFSIAAWAFPNKTGGLRTVLGQDGSQVSAFAVQYRPSDSRWVVRVPTADVANPTSVLLTSTESVVVGQWMHLAVSYDAPQRRLRLYVNGALSAVQVDVAIPGSTGPLSVGRSKWNGANAELFGGVIDDVRAFDTLLSDGEVRKIYDDVYLALHGYWRFDGTGADTSWRQNPTTLSGTPSYVPGVNDRALQLDGTAVAAKAERVGVPMIGSFTVSAWAKLGRTDRVQTVLGEDGTRMSGFVLQYRPEYNRWVFGAKAQDADGAALTLVTSPQPPAVNTWTHLTGVYDYPAHQLRLYVDGEPAGIRNNVSLWAAWGGFTIGRGKVNGQPAEFFAGAIDEVSTDMGAASDAEIARRAAYPAPPTGQFGRFVNARGDHYTASNDAPAPPGYHFEASLGGVLPAGAANTRMLYACQFNADAFTSADPNCENQVRLGEIGLVYAEQPASPQTVPIYRCNNGPDHFDAIRCPGTTQEFLLGYTVGYAPMPRYNHPVGWDHLSTVNGTPPGYYREGTLGFVSLAAVPGGQELFSCRNGYDVFTSTDANCEGKTKLSSIGWIWAQPPEGVPSAPLFRCGLGRDSFDSRSDTCEGNAVDRQLGYVLTAIPESPAN